MNRHNPPPVSYPIVSSSFLGMCLLGLWLAGFSSVMVVVQRASHLDWRMVLALLCVLAAGVAARRGWKNMPNGRLAWNGEAWCFQHLDRQASTAWHTLKVVADFQHRLLLRLENQAPAGLWLWVERGAMPERWLDLRRAVYSPHKSSEPLARHDALDDEPPSGPSQVWGSSLSNSSMSRRQSHEF